MRRITPLQTGSRGDRRSGRRLLGPLLNGPSFFGRQNGNSGLGVRHTGCLMDTLFHYTTATGLLGTLRGPSLWCSDLRFLNDAQEALYGRDLVVEAIRTMDNPVRDPAHWAYEHGDSAIDIFSGYQRMVVEELLTSEFGVYVACFCESGDLLSQWRGYGKDHGYAVELRTEALQKALNEVPTYPAASGLFKVRYGHEAADSVVRSALEEVARFNLNHPGVKAHITAQALSSMLSRIKHPGSFEEQEWRLVVGLEISDESQTSTERKATLYRATQRAIVPYIELPLERDAITSIRVGPGDNADVREAGVRRLLKTLGSEATVTRSEVPLRT